MDNILVSLLITAYNRENYISEAIESVLASTYINFELIIADDFSTDKTLAIARAYQQKDSRIKVFENEKNTGQFANRNKVASYAKGKYIKYVDSDDIIYPYTLQMMVNGMEQFPQAGLGFCLTHGPCKHPLPYQVESKDAYQQHFFEGGLLFVGPSGWIIRRSAFESVKGFDEYGMPSDNHFALKVAGKYPVVAITRDLFWWRLHPGQVFNQNLNNHQNILNNYNYTKDIILYHSPMDAQQSKIMLKNQRKIFLSNIIRLAFKKLKPLAAIRLLRMAREAVKHTNL